MNNFIWIQICSVLLIFPQFFIFSAAKIRQISKETKDVSKKWYLHDKVYEMEFFIQGQVHKVAFIE